MLSTVAMMLIAPMIELMPIMCTAKITMATLAPPCSISGGYMVQPPAGAPPGMKKVDNSRVKANGRIQNDQLFMRGSAMSGAPICNGIIQLPRPTKAGMIAPKIITSARSEEHTSELQSLMRISYAVFCLKKKNDIHKQQI